MTPPAYDCYLVDLDGTAYIGERPVPHAVSALNALGERVVYVTNNASRSPEMVAARLTRIGYRTDPHHIVTSAQLATRLLQNELAPGTEVLVVGAPYLEEVVRTAGFSTVRIDTPRTEAVVQGHSEQTGWPELSAAARAIRSGARYFATNRDTSLPSEQGLNVGNGAMVGAVEISTGVPARAAGKPEASSMQYAARLIGGQRPLVIGDRLDTDIAGGNNAGYDTLCVLTGVATLADICQAAPAQRPTYALPNLSFLTHIVSAPAHLRLDTDSSASARPIVELNVSGSGAATVHFCDTSASSPEKLAALIQQAWHTGYRIRTFVGRDDSDIKELISWQTR